MIESIIGTMIGREVFSQTISKSTSGLYVEIDNLIHCTEYDFIALLEKLDINTKHEVSTLLIKEYEEINTIFTDSCKKCINSLIDIIDKITKEIIDIQNEIKEHNLKWFHKWRSNTYDNKIQNLITHNTILENRLNLFIKLIQL